MSNNKPKLDDEFVVIPTPESPEVDLDILKREAPFREGKIPVMQTPEDWPPPPDDVEKAEG